MKKKPFYTLEEIETLLKEENHFEDLHNFRNDTEKDVVIAILQEGNYGKRIKSQKIYKYTLKEVEEAIEYLDHITRYADIDQYHECCDETINDMDMDTLTRYFDYDQFHNDCDFDITEAENGIVLQW